MQKPATGLATHSHVAVASTWSAPAARCVFVLRTSFTQTASCRMITSVIAVVLCS